MFAGQQGNIFGPSVRKVTIVGSELCCYLVIVKPILWIIWTPILTYWPNSIDRADGLLKALLNG